MQPVQAQEVVTSSSWFVPSLQLSPFSDWALRRRSLFGISFLLLIPSRFLRKCTKMLFKNLYFPSKPALFTPIFRKRSQHFFFSLETHKIPPGGLNTNILCHAFDWLVLLLFTTYTPSLCSPAELHSVPSAFHYAGLKLKGKIPALENAFLNVNFSDIGGKICCFLCCTMMILLGHWN